jgi:hypothetical protein
MAGVTAQVRPEFAHLYPALTRGRWYDVDQGGREQNGDSRRTLHVECEAGLVEVAADHAVCRKSNAA